MRLEGKSEQTIGNYTRICREVLPMGQPLTSLDKDLIDRIMMAKAHLKSSSRRHVAEMLKGLCRFAVFEYGLPARVLQAIPSIKAVPDERPCWDLQKIRAIIEAVEHPNESVCRQFQLYLKVLAQTGARQGECAELRWENINVDHTITFPAAITKTRTARVVPIPRSLYQELMQWHRPQGLIFDLIPRTQSGRYSLLKKALDKVGLPGSLHTFRKTASTMLYYGCGDIKACSQILGHSAATALTYYQRTRKVDELRRIIELNDIDRP